MSNKSSKYIFLLSVLGILFVVIFVFAYFFQRPKDIKVGLGAAIPGDCDGINGVDILDFQLLSNAFGRSEGESGYDGRCNFHIDIPVNIIDILDFQILSNNFGNTGITNTPTTKPQLSSTITPYPTIPTDKNSYYVSPSGNDNNPGTANQPFSTFAKALSLMNPGDTLYIYGGTYTQQLSVSKSGTASAPLNIRAMPGQVVKIDAEASRDNPVYLTGNYIDLEGLDVSRGSYDCVQIRGTHININKFNVHDCFHFAIRVASTGKYVTVENSEIHDNETENIGGANTSGSWGAALSAKQGSSFVTFRNNKSYNNWGEGITAGAASQINIVGNIAYDNYSINIYIDNSWDVVVEKNFTYSIDSTYYRSGNPANCITASDEVWTGIGHQLKNVSVINNIGYGCKTGVGYTYTEISENGCENCLFAYNTLVNTQGIKIIAGTNNSATIKNNIVYGGNITAPAGTIISNNLTTNPLFSLNPGINPQSYRLSSSSPAINGGVSISGITDDFEGKTRSTEGSPGVDIGAIEYQ